MADLSLDEIIATKKGYNFKVQFSNQNVRKQGNPSQSGAQRKDFRPGFAAGFGQRGTFQQKTSFKKSGLKTKSSGQRGNSVQSNATNLLSPGRGQIDARDMITIKNRIKMSDARVKIVQKRIGQKTFDARSKLQRKRPPQSGARPQGGSQQPGSQQQLVFQQPPHSIMTSAQQRFQSGTPVSFSQAPGFQQVHTQNKSADLVNFSVAINPVPSSRPVGPLTRTLQNPLAGKGTLVENTGSSLKITRTIPDVSFDGQNLTVTRRLLQGSKSQNSAPPSLSGSRPRMDRDRGPVIQFQNDKYQPTPIQAPASGNVVRTRPAPIQGGQRARPPSPIQPPVSKRAPVKGTRAEENVVKTSSSSGHSTNARYKTMKNVSALTPASKMRESDPVSEEQLRPPPSASASALQSKRPAQSSTSDIQHQTLSASVSSRLSRSGLPASKRLAPRPSGQSQSGEQRVSAKGALKRRAPMSLSERFGAREAGSSSPVIIDHAPPKKRRVPEREREPDKEECEEDFEGKDQSEEEEEEEEEPEVPVLSPLQGFRILVTNLHANVTQDDIIELFGVIGPLKRANLLSKGQAEVAFIHKEHAVMALKKYHNRELDGQPMFVKVTTPLNAKVMKPPSSEDGTPGLPPSLRSNKKAPASASSSAPVEIPLIHKALFKTGTDSVPSKSVRFTVKL